MGHPKVHNNTPFEFAPLFLADGDGQPLFVPLLKGTFVLTEESELVVAEKQAAPMTGGAWYAEPDMSSVKYAPEAVTVKPATDVVLLGHAYPERLGDTETTVGLRVGSVRKLVSVIGDRHWVRSGDVTVMSAPLPFEKIPLRWERAFGGWDRGSPDPQEHRFEARNPVGRGFRVQWNELESSVALPNLEHPAQLIRNFEDRPEPVGFGFLGPHWMPRAQYAGTYDAAWLKSRMPLLPADFDPKFLNAAPADQIVAGYLCGDEEVVVLNASVRGRLSFFLPNAGIPRFDVELRGGGGRSLISVLDTVIVDADRHLVSMLWRASLPVDDVPADVVTVHIDTAPRTGAPRYPVVQVV